MTDTNTPTPTNIPPLPKPPEPKRDVWGRDLPLPNPNPPASPVTQAQPQGAGSGGQANAAAKAVKDNTEAVEHLMDENGQIFSDILNQFESYVDNIKKSNQNFFLKQGKLLASEFRKGVISGMVEGAEKSGELGKLEDVNYNLRVIYNNLDKMITAQNETVKIAKEDQEENKKEKIKNKAKEASEKEDKKESKLWAGLSQMFLGSTYKDKLAKAKKEKEEKRYGGLMGEGGIMSMIGSFLFKFIPLTAMAIGLLGPDGTEKLVQAFGPAAIQLSQIVYDKMVVPGIKMAGQLTKDLIIDPALKKMGIKQETFNKTLYGDEKAKPGEFNSPYEKDGSFNPFDPKHGLKVIKDVIQYLFPGTQSAKLDLSPKGLKESREQQKAQIDRWMGRTKEPTGSPDDRQAKNHPVEPPITPNEYKTPLKERDDFVPPTMDDDVKHQILMNKLDAQDKLRIKEQSKNSNYISDFLDQQKNMVPSVAPLTPTAVSPEDQQKAFDKINADMTSTWKNGVNNFFTGLTNAFTGDGGLMTPIGKLTEPKQNDFSNMLSDMDRFSKVTSTMKTQAKVDATKSVTPIIVQAPTSINTSQTVSNGTTVNTPARTRNDRSLLGYR